MYFSATIIVNIGNTKPNQRNTENSKNNETTSLWSITTFVLSSLRSEVEHGSFTLTSCMGSRAINLMAISLKVSLTNVVPQHLKLENFVPWSTFVPRSGPGLNSGLNKIRKFPHSSNDPVIQVAFLDISPHKQFMSNHVLAVNIPYKNFQTVQEKKYCPLR